MKHNHWWNKRTHKDCPEDYGYLAAKAWARGYNAAVNAYINELEETLLEVSGQ